MSAEKVFAIKAKDLWDIIPYVGKGFIRLERSVVGDIMRKGLFLSRDLLENDPLYKQLIPYGVISCDDFVFMFNRKSAQTEKRLHNKYSLGVGGHSNPLDDEISDYFIEELKREFYEEVSMVDNCALNSVELIGFINDDTTSVGEVHIGMYYNISLSAKALQVKEVDKMSGFWIHNEEIAKYYLQMESWSQIIYDSQVI